MIAKMAMETPAHNGFLFFTMRYMKAPSDRTGTKRKKKSLRTRGRRLSDVNKDP